MISGKVKANIEFRNPFIKLSFSNCAIYLISAFLSAYLRCDLISKGFCSSSTVDYFWESNVLSIVMILILILYVSIYVSLLSNVHLIHNQYNLLICILLYYIFLQSNDFDVSNKDIRKYFSNYGWLFYLSPQP